MHQVNQRNNFLPRDAMTSWRVGGGAIYFSTDFKTSWRYQLHQFWYILLSENTITQTLENCKKNIVVIIEYRMKYGKLR